MSKTLKIKDSLFTMDELIKMVEEFKDINGDCDTILMSREDIKRYKSMLPPVGDNISFRGIKIIEE